MSLTFTAEAGADGVWRLRYTRKNETSSPEHRAVTEFSPVAARTNSRGRARSHAAPGAQPLSLDPRSGAFTWGGISCRGVDTTSITIPVPVDDNRRDAVRLTLDEPDARAWHGLGEKTGYLDKKGRTWRNWNTDPANSLHERFDPIYVSWPFLVGRDPGRAGRPDTFFGLFLDSARYSEFALGIDEGLSTLAVAASAFDLYLIPGPRPADVVRRFHALTGSPAMPPLWALGTHQCRWGYESEKDIREVAGGYAKRRMPLGAIWLDIDYMDAYKVFTFSKERFPRPSRLVRDLAKRGTRTVCIVDPGVKAEKGYHVFDEGVRGGHFVRNPDGSDFIGEVWPGKSAWPDFTRPEVREWWAGLHRFYADHGVAGIWNDMNEPAVFNSPGHTMPIDRVHGNLPRGRARSGAVSKERGVLHEHVHNLYANGQAEAAFEGQRRHRPDARPFLLTRAGFPGIQRHAWIWTGDNTASWEHLEMSISMILNMGLSGIPFAGADIGGFAYDSNGELLARWTWLGAFHPFMRNHAAKGSARQEPWCFGPKVEAICGDAIRFRYRLLPYLYTLAREAVETGAPLARPLFWEFPGDRDAAAVHDQFLLGDALLVAPVTRPGWTKRTVYLPRGEWECFWTGRREKGARFVTVEAPLDRIPVFLRSGRAVPLARRSTIPTNAWWKSLEWRVPRKGAWSGRVYSDAGDGPAEGDWITFRGRSGPRTALTVPGI